MADKYCECGKYLARVDERVRGTCVKCFKEKEGKDE